RLLDQVEQHALADDAIALADRALPVEVGAPVHRVDAGKTADVSRDDAVHREQQRGRGLGASGPDRAAIADAVRPVANRVAGGGTQAARPTPAAADARRRGSITTAEHRKNGRDMSVDPLALRVQLGEGLAERSRDVDWHR